MEIKALLDKTAIIIDFNPWNSQDRNHIVKDFFSILSSSLSSYYSGVSMEIENYVSLLYSLRLNLYDKLVLQHLPRHTQEYIEKKKQGVACALKNINQPIVVAIDDIDRLAGKEIFEVLRIIRNTANFNNIIYIVTYDKEHVIQQLGCSDVNIDEDYLEKIFQIELSMPKIDERMLMDEFRNLCRKSVKNTSLINSTLDSLTDEDYNQIINVLWSFRKVKRFVRQFSFNTNYMIRSFIDGTSTPLKDVMFLNIIQTLDYRLYQQMWMSPGILFDIKKDPKTKCQYYVVKPSTLNSNATSSYFLRNLFGVKSDSRSNSLQMVDAFYKYFYLSQPERVLSESDFREMLKQTPSEVALSGMKSTIRGWVLSKDSKTASSIYNCFVKTMSHGQAPTSDGKRYLSAIFYWLEYEERTSANIEEAISISLGTSLYKKKDHQVLSDYAKSLLNKWLEKKQFEKTAKVLSRLYVDIDGGTKMLFNIDDVINAISNSIKKFLDSQEWDAVLLFKSDDNPLLRLARAYCVKKKGSDYRKSLAIDLLISFFSQSKNISKRNESISSYKNSLEAYRIFGDHTGGVNWDEMKNVFGDDLDKADDYLKKCFK